MAAIAIGRLFGPFTAAQQISPAALGTKYHGREAAADVGTVAKGLPSAAPAATPNIAFAFGEFDFDRVFLSDIRFFHVYMLGDYIGPRQSPISLGEKAIPRRPIFTDDRSGSPDREEGQPWPNGIIAAILSKWRGDSQSF